MKPAPKLLGSLRLKLRVALASFAVLIAGSLIAPRAVQTPLTLPPERPAPLLEEQAASRTVVLPFEGVQQVHARIRDRIVVIRGATDPRARTTIDYRLPLPPATAVAGFGISVTAGGEVLTHEDALGGRASVRIDVGGGRERDGQVVAYEPASGLVMLQTSEASGVSPSFAEPAEPGQLAAAYFPVANGHAVVPVFITSVAPDEYAIAPAGAVLRPGTPIYDMAGDLLAMTAGSGRGPTAVPLREAAERLVDRVRSGTAQPASLGVRFQSLVGDVTKVFGQTGALVADVVPGGPADAAGIEPGDVVIAIGDTIVQSPEAAHHVISSLSPGAAVDIRVRRNDDTRAIRVESSAAFEVAAIRVGHDDASAAPFVPASELFAPAALNAAAIPADARVTSVNKRRVSSRADALRELRRGPPPALVQVESREGERFFAVVDGTP